MNKLNKKRVMSMLFSLVLTSSLAACSGAAQTQPASAADAAVTSKLAASNIAASDTVKSSVADSVVSALSNGASKDAAVNSKSAASSSKPAESTAAKSTAVNNANLSYANGNTAKVEGVNTGSTSSCPYTLPTSSTLSKLADSVSPGNNTSNNKFVRYIISGNNSSCTSGNSISCNSSFCGTSVCSIINCNQATCKNSDCKSASCKQSTSSKPTTSTPSTPSKPTTSTPAAPSKPTSSAPSTGTTSSPTQTNGTMANQVLQLVNAERAKNGLGALTMNANASKAAQVRATEIVTSFSHTRPSGQDPFTALKQFGVSYSTAGENIAYGYPDAKSVMTAWMNSPGHRANILNGSFKQVGVGVYQANGTYYWTQEFIG